MPKEMEPSTRDALIGKKVVKRSGRPFKSGKKVATVIAVTVNPFTDRDGFCFEEDDSIVECRMVREATSDEILL